MKQFLQPKYLLIAVMVLGFVLRIWGLGSAELFQDEGFYAFRSIGYVDYIDNRDQTTPIQWFRNSELPLWTNLSFHDHPPLFFLVQHSFFRMFGDSLFVARLPSLLAGIFSILLLYAISKRLFKNAYAGVFAAFLLSIHHVHIWVSRSSIMESFLLFVVLLNIYFFLRFLENKRFWFAFGATLGLTFLTKYTAFFLIPVYAAYLFWKRSGIYKEWRLYAALLITLILFSPVLIYNYQIFKTLGHFDLQFSYLFGQEAPEWPAAFGKVNDPISQIGRNLTDMFSLPFLIFSFAGLIYSISSKEVRRASSTAFVWLATFFTTLLFVFIGSAPRFLSLYSPFLILLIIPLFLFLWQRFSKEFLFKILFAGFLVYEIYFTVVGIYLTFPDFGIKKLDQYLNESFEYKRSSLVPDAPNPHINKIIQSHLKRDSVSDTKFAIIYDENINLASRIWTFTRRTFYHGTVSITAAQFRELLRSQGIELFEGVEFYFVKATGNASRNPYLYIADADNLEAFLRSELDLSPETTIYGHFNKPMFFVYKFTL